MLEKLTKKQIEYQVVKRDEWIDLALHKQNFDKEELEAGVKWLYYSSNLKEPEVVFVDGPKDFSKKFRASVGASVWASVSRDSVWASVRDSVRDSVWASVRDSVWASVWDSVRDSVRASVWASVWDSVWASVSWTSLAYDSDFGAWYEYYKDIKAIKPQENADKYMGFLRAGAFFCMFFEKKAFVMRRPIRVEQNLRKQVHSLTGSALAFADGTEFYKINGVEFDKKLWTKVASGKMTAKEVFAIENLEQRRVAYELMDKTKMKDLADYKVLDEVKDDGYGYPMNLISFTLKKFDTPFYYLNCFDPSTGREYFVETRKQKCWEAKMGSFGLKENERFTKEW